MTPKVSFPLFALFGLTRGMAGAGAGLLLADRIPAVRRRRIGSFLLAIGALSTIPLMITIARRSRRSEMAGEAEAQGYTPSPGVEAQEAEILSSGAPNIRP